MIALAGVDTSVARQMSAGGEAAVALATDVPTAKRRRGLSRLAEHGFSLKGWGGGGQGRH